MPVNPEYYCGKCSGALFNTATNRECEDCGWTKAGLQPDKPEIIEE